MVVFPVRKCYHVAKVLLLLVLVVSILSLFEQWRGGKRSTSAAQTQFLDPLAAEYERQVQEDEALIVPGLGEEGNAAYLIGEDKRLGEESEKKLAVNVYLSDRIAYNRTLKDRRNPACERVIYDAELPSASVILIFHNEPYSVVIRTMWSVINSARRSNPWFAKANTINRETGQTMNLGYPGQDPNSEYVYLKEIILVDDNSTLPELKGKLSHYVRTRMPPDLIKIIRLPDRVGLTRARLAGARLAVGTVLVFLDSHCEGQQDWLRPLLMRIKQEPHAVLVPIIDVIDADNFLYSVQDSRTFQVGGFSFLGHFTWIEVPEREKKRRGSDIAPTWSPTMAGGLFAMNREYFWELGAYDEQMGGWGGENLEISFRIWQCGGTLETVPCSRVGHVFRSFHPYGMPSTSDTHGINTARMAEVWMDEYAELFYIHRPDLRKSRKIGDVTHRRVLREKLHCKDFQWYLDNVYPEKYVPVRNVYGYGRFVNPSSGMCMDTLQKDEPGAALGTYPCHPRLHATQYLSLARAGQLRDEDRCAELHYVRHNEVDDDNVGRPVVMATCRENSKGQKWQYVHSSGTIRHISTGLCLQPDSGVLVAATCTDNKLQVWKIDYNEDNDFTRADGDEDKELQDRLRVLRGPRRISRSLLSIDANSSETYRRTNKKRNKKKKHKKRKRVSNNKFLLQLVRGSPPEPVRSSPQVEDHLEVEIHCKHRKLYPNNSFVRDLVTILNEKGIKVINNGRVFEKNKVTLLTPTKQPDLTRGGAEGPKTKLVQDSPPPPDPPQPAAPPPPAAAPAPGPAPVSPPLSPAARAREARLDEDLKRIIVEDFISIKPDHATKRSKKWKRHRSRLPADGQAPARHASRHTSRHDVTHAPQHRKALTNVWKESQEGVNALSSDSSLERATQSGSNEATTGDARTFNFRASDANATHGSDEMHELTQDVSVYNNDVEPRARDASLTSRTSQYNKELKPVKVVMRSNLTFKLGDDFFRWKENVPVELNAILNELSIPTKRDSDATRHRDGDDTKSTRQRSDIVADNSGVWVKDYPTTVRYADDDSSSESEE